MSDPPTQIPPRLTTNNSYGSYGARVKKTSLKYESYRSWNGGGGGGGLQFGGADEDSDVCSPPLWKTSPSRNPNLHHHQNNYRYLSPAQKTQAVAKGQRELMEMIRNMPESCYELSLKDLVERPMIESRHDQNLNLEKINGADVLNRNELEKRKDNKNRKKNEKKAKMNRSGSMDNNGGFLLKMVFPVSWGSRNKNNKKNKNNSTTATMTTTTTAGNSKVTPKPISDGSSAKGVDKEWWKKRFANSGDSESGGMSSNNSASTGSSGSSGSGSGSIRSSSNGSRRGHRVAPRCCSFFLVKKSKKPK